MEGIADSLKDMLTRFKASNVTLAPKKFQFGEEVVFAGMRITKDGCAADPDRMDAVANFPWPESRSQVRGGVYLNTTHSGRDREHHKVWKRCREEELGIHGSDRS